jgi:hypothetical protein
MPEPTKEELLARIAELEVKVEGRQQDRSRVGRVPEASAASATPRTTVVGK